jgi:hypothetical protein
VIDLLSSPLTKRAIDPPEGILPANIAMTYGFPATVDYANRYPQITMGADDHQGAGPVEWANRQSLLLADNKKKTIRNYDCIIGSFCLGRAGF